VGLFALLFLVVLGVAAGAVWWFGRNQYFVGQDGTNVAVFKGRPGGLLWLDPTLERRTDLCNCPPDVPAARVDDIKAGKQFSTLADANRYVRNIREEATASTRTFPTTPTSLLSPAPGTSPQTTTPPP
jgi:protein phosphatase